MFIHRLAIVLITDVIPISLGWLVINWALKSGCPEDILMIPGIIWGIITVLGFVGGLAVLCDDW